MLYFVVKEGDKMLYIVIIVLIIIIICNNSDNKKKQEKLNQRIKDLEKQIAQYKEKNNQSNEEIWYR